MDKGTSTVGQTFKVQWGGWAPEGIYDIGVNKNHKLCTTIAPIPVGSTGVIVEVTRTHYITELTFPSGDFFESVLIDIADFDFYVCSDEDADAEAEAAELALLTAWADLENAKEELAYIIAEEWDYWIPAARELVRTYEQILIDVRQQQQRSE